MACIHGRMINLLVVWGAPLENAQQYVQEADDLFTDEELEDQLEDPEAVWVDFTMFMLHIGD